MRWTMDHPPDIVTLISDQQTERFRSDAVGQPTARSEDEPAGEGGDEPQKTTALRVLVLLVLLPLLYALSIGPAWCLCAATRSGQEAFLIFYGPVLYVCQYIGLRELMYAYINWWASFLALT